MTIFLRTILRIIEASAAIMHILHKQKPQVKENSNWPKKTKLKLINRSRFRWKRFRYIGLYDVVVENQCPIRFQYVISLKQIRFVDISNHYLTPWNIQLTLELHFIPIKRESVCSPLISSQPFILSYLFLVIRKYKHRIESL